MEESKDIIILMLLLLLLLQNTYNSKVTRILNIITNTKEDTFLEGFKKGWNEEKEKREKKKKEKEKKKNEIQK